LLARDCKDIGKEKVEKMRGAQTVTLLSYHPLPFYDTADGIPSNSVVSRALWASRT